MRPLAQMFPVLILAASALDLLSPHRSGESEQLHASAVLVRAEFDRLTLLGASLASASTFRLSDCRAWLLVYDALVAQWGESRFVLTVTG